MNVPNQGGGYCFTRSIFTVLCCLGNGQVTVTSSVNCFAGKDKDLAVARALRGVLPQPPGLWRWLRPQQSASQALARAFDLLPQPPGLYPRWKTTALGAGRASPSPEAAFHRPPRAMRWARPGPWQAWLEGPTYQSSASGCSAGPVAAAAASGPASSSDKERGAGLGG